MTQIIRTRIKKGAEFDTRIFMLLGADIHFTAPDLDKGSSGAAIYELECIIWDDDTLFNDRLARKVVQIPQIRIATVTSMEIQFELLIAKLRESEPSSERVIELFGEFKLRRNGRQIGSSRSSSNFNYRFPSGMPVASPA
jgi:hypothetical protein